jgi:hypothetical protein
VIDQLRLALILAIPVLAAGCSANKPVNPELPKQPLAFVQNQAVKEPYSGVMPYVVCYGIECDQPTPKHAYVAAVLDMKETVMASKPVQIIKVEKQLTKGSVRYIYNTTVLAEDAESTIAKLIALAKNSKQVLINGYAGLTNGNAEKEDKVLALALSRARDIEARFRKGGVTSDIKVAANLERCKSEKDCLTRYVYGGRRTDVEIILITAGDQSGK